MYRIIHNVTHIFAMAEDRDRILDRMKSKSEILMEHIGKCILWGKEYHSYNHWVNSEIVTFINEFARKRPKSKLKESIIRATLFRAMGDEIQDAINNLYDIYEESQLESDPYPEVDITYQQGVNFFKAYNQIADVISSYLANHRIETGRVDYRDEIRSMVLPILNKYC